MSECIFCKIVSHEISVKPVFEDEAVIVFPDIHPQAPFHALIVPKKHVKDFMELENSEIWGKIREAIRLVIEKEKLDGKGFRIVVNGGGAQGVDHLHVHLLGGVNKEREV